MPNQIVGQSQEILEIWTYVPDDILMHIFQFLPADSLLKVAQVCRTWCRLAADEFLWRDLVYRHWSIDRSIPRSSHCSCWRDEYERLSDCCPVVESEVLRSHSDQVLHVSFSHDGRLFATTSKDGFIKVWKSSFPVELWNEADMKVYLWKYTQFARFNTSDTMLLVSGVHPGDNGTMGEIAVFSTRPSFVFLRKFRNKPYDIFGTWFDDMHLLSGDLHWRGNLASCSSLWLWEAVDTNEPARLVYKFPNTRASSVRTVMVARHTCDVLSDTKHRMSLYKPSGDSQDSHNNLDFNRDRLLIFTKGSQTYTPHQIGIKRMPSSVTELLAEQRAHEADVETQDFGQNDDDADDDDVDVTVELHGHIIGMNLSPDHRYLYINSRAWPKGYTISDPLYPPPIAEKISIHVLDLQTMHESGPVFHSHKAFTSNDECFFIFLDVSDPYVASGAEDHHGYLWDRHYHVCLSTFQHDDVVNCVAFNPHDPETLVSVSDDNTIKVWRSRRRHRQLNSTLVYATD